MGIFNEYDFGVDSQLRTLSISKVEQKLLEFYKKNFRKLVRDELNNLDELKRIEFG